MDPQLLNLILDALKSHGLKLESIQKDVTELKTTVSVAQHEDRIQKLESVAWYAKVVVGLVGFVGTVAYAAKAIGIL